MSCSLRSMLIGLSLLGLATTGFAQATDIDCSKCVDTQDIAYQAITTGKIKQQAVTSSKIGTSAISTAKIKNGAVSAEKIDPGQVQIRVDGTCAVGSFVTAIAQDGSVVCGTGNIIDNSTVASLHATDLNLHFALNRIGEEIYSCGQSYLFGCEGALSGNGSAFLNVTYYVRTNSVRMYDSTSDIDVFGLPITPEDFSQLRWVGRANLMSLNGHGQVLVDSCDAPTVVLVDATRNPRLPTFSPKNVMDNSGRLYTRDNYDYLLVDVTANVYGMMNFIVHGDNVTPICTPGVSDRTGVWKQFTYSYAVDTYAPQFAGPFTYSGTSVGVLDRLDALESF